VTLIKETLAPSIPPPSSPCFVFVCDLDNHHQLNLLSSTGSDEDKPPVLDWQNDNCAYPRTIGLGRSLGFFTSISPPLGPTIVFNEGIVFEFQLEAIGSIADFQPYLLFF
jgi:hypothetical protein